MAINVMLSGSGTNADAVVALPADAAHRHVIGALVWSYSATPTSGRLFVTDAGTTIFDVDVTVAGSGSSQFPAGLESTALGNPVTVTLTAGGLNVTGKINVDWHDENT